MSLRLLLRSLDRDRLILSYYYKDTDFYRSIRPFLELSEARTIEDELDDELEEILLGLAGY